jgi:osmotically-inducible protein OsmY
MSTHTHTDAHWTAWSLARQCVAPVRAVWRSVRARREDAATHREDTAVEVVTRSCDAEIRDRVERRLAGDEALRGSEIHVDAVYDGIVVLGGSAATAAAEARAFEDAANVPSVRRVRNEIVSHTETQNAA